MLEATGHAGSDDGFDARGYEIRGASFRNGLIPHMEALAAELGVAAIEPTADVSAPEFFRMRLSRCAIKLVW